MSSTLVPVNTLRPLPPGRAYRFHTMVKPAGALCNLDCTYCFYLHKTGLLGHRPNARMDEATLAQHIRQYIEANTGEEVVFSWQGGEPTVMGLAFFERVVALQAEYRKRGQRIENDLQTNGILLDEQWVRFLQRNRFMVGLSIDGPRALHDRYRVTRGGAPTFDRVMRAARMLSDAQVAFAALCVVNRDVARSPLDVWRFLSRETGTWRVQFTPCVEPRCFAETGSARLKSNAPSLPGSAPARAGEPDSVVTDWSVDAGDYGAFLCAVWDDWLAQHFGRVHVNVFETAVAQSLGMPAQTCVASPVCGKALALEHDGTLYACDHFVYPEYRLGDIGRVHEGDLAFSQRQVSFGLAKRDTLPAYCRSCEHLHLCWGECPKNRLLSTPDGEAGLNYLCSGLKAFYGRVARDMPEIRRRLGAPAPHPSSVPGAAS
ncbi:MAG: anaerobic sulfatase maturase [Burkholderiales bacterium]|nr:anaerobic sulfatase maturase [Burkholderiales bacterium]